MELGVAEREGVGQAIIRDFDFLGEPWLELWRIVLPPHQTVIQVDARGDPADVEDRMRVQRVVGRRVGENEFAARLGGISNRASSSTLLVMHIFI